MFLKKMEFLLGISSFQAWLHSACWVFFEQSKA